MTQEELKKALDSHKRWLKGEPDGVRLDLPWEDLRNADLHGAILDSANLRCADLRGATLHKASLYCANLRWADLRNANLEGTNLRKTNLHCANLRGAKLDFAAYPLWCGSLDMKIDKRIAAQLLYHALRAMQSCADEPDVAAVLASKPCLKLANQFHRVDECGKIEPPKKEGKK